MKVIFPSNFIELYTKLDVVLGWKLSGPTNTLTKASNLTFEFYRKGELENGYQNLFALDKLSNYKNGIT